MLTEESRYKEVQLGPRKFEIPNSWPVDKLGVLTNKKKGKKPGQLFEDNSEEENLIPYLSANYMRDNKKAEYCKESDSNKIEAKDKNIIMIWDGSYSGHVFTGFSGALSSTMVKIEVGRNIKEKYLYYLLSENFPVFQSTTIGTSVPHVARSIFGNLNVPVPPIIEQKKIAEVLSTVDDAIQKTEEIIERTKELKKGLMQDLLTKGIGHEEFKEVQLGPKKVTIPSNWVLKPLQEILKKEESGVWGDDPEEGSGVPVLRATNYGEYGIDLEEDTAKRSISDSKDGKKLEKGDIVLERSGGSPYQPVGRVLYFDLEGEFYPGNFLQLLRPDPAKIDPKFLFYRLDYIYEKGDTLTMQTRTTNIRNLQYNLYLAQKVPIPPITEQKQIADALSTVDEKIQQERNYKEKLEELKKGLMQDLLTGKVRVLPLLSDEEKEELKEANVPG